ncbi:hypothetical protein PY365_08045 [Roseiarcaceae bacterium H3SJ34-1]|uniref:hypothetical protein n=1 Tax=Terripilifer ovatus TaxID=3032367 RepID=UPI003AB9959A|nr:hypothetical protein [Roseiarcaceae bacterium H3SJ34-1]
MSAKETTSVVSIINGKPKELFSVRERKAGEKAGELYVFPNAARFNWSNEDRRQKETTGQKYSIHRTNLATGGTSIHHTLESKNADPVHTHTYTFAHRDRKVAPLYFERIRNLTQTPDVTNAKTKTIASYSPTIWTQLIGIFAAPKDATIDFIEDSPMYVRSIMQFKDCAIIVLSTYMRIPASVEGWISHYATAPISKGKVMKTPGLQPHGGYCAADARGLAESRFGVLYGEGYMWYFASMKNIYGTNHPIWSALMEAHKLGFYKDPDQSRVNYPPPGFVEALTDPVQA